MSTLIIDNVDPVTMRILAAWGASQNPPVSVPDLVRRRGILSAVLDAVGTASRLVVESGSVADDVMDIVARDQSAVWQGLSAAINNGVAPPESLAAILEARAPRSVGAAA